MSHVKCLSKVLSVSLYENRILRLVAVVAMPMWSRSAPAYYSLYMRPKYNSGRDACTPLHNGRRAN